MFATGGLGVGAQFGGVSAGVQRARREKWRARSEKLAGTIFSNASPRDAHLMMFELFLSMVACELRLVGKWFVLDDKGADSHFKVWKPDVCGERSLVGDWPGHHIREMITQVSCS